MKNFLTEQEVLNKYNKIFTKANLYNACRYQQLPFYKNGKRKFYNELDIIEWLESKRVIIDKEPKYAW